MCGVVSPVSATSLAEPELFCSALAVFVTLFFALKRYCIPGKSGFFRLLRIHMVS
jgi:hypothetical protein